MHYVVIRRFIYKPHRPKGEYTYSPQGAYSKIFLLYIMFRRMLLIIFFVFIVSTSSTSTERTHYWSNLPPARGGAVAATEKILGKPVLFEAASWWHRRVLWSEDRYVLWLARPLHSSLVLPCFCWPVHMDLLLRERPGIYMANRTHMVLMCLLMKKYNLCSTFLSLASPSLLSYSSLQRREDLCFILFALLNIVWATLFLESWKRTSSELAHRWGTLDSSSEMLNEPRPLFKVRMQLSRWLVITSLHRACSL